MPLSDEQMEEARRYFLRSGVVPDCPYCSMHGWAGGEIISVPTGFDGSGTGSEEPATVPMVQFVCNNCGHITLFDARRLGFISG